VIKGRPDRKKKLGMGDLKKCRDSHFTPTAPSHGTTPPCPGPLYGTPNPGMFFDPPSKPSSLTYVLRWFETKLQGRNDDNFPSIRNPFHWKIHPVLV